MTRRKLLAPFACVAVALFALTACGDATSTTAPAVVSTTAPAAASTTAPAAAGAATTAPVVSAPTPSGANAVTSGAIANGDASGLPKLVKKDKYRVGFSQTESNNPWRLAQTASMKDEAAKRGFELVYTDAAGSTAKQVADIESLIAQKVDALFISPREEKPLVKPVLEAKAAGIPVFLIDRNVDATQATPGKDFVTFVGSDFVQEGKRAADWLIKATNGTAKIIQLQGTTGASAATDRQTGFESEIKGTPGLQIIASQSGNFTRDEGRKTMETLLVAHPEVTAIFAQNDEMAIGAISALEAAGKVPGKDVIIVSVDGEKDGLQAIIDGKLGATVECNPRFGPKAFETMLKYANGETIPTSIINVDNFYDIGNAKTSIAGSY